MAHKLLQCGALKAGFPTLLQGDSRLMDQEWTILDAPTIGGISLSPPVCRPFYVCWKAPVGRESQSGPTIWL